MGQKVHPYGFRVGYNKDWHSHWFAKQDFATFLAEDLKLKRELKRKFGGGGVSHIDIERAATRLKIIIYTSRPGIIIGRKGAEIARTEWSLQGRLPLHTLRADIDFGFAEALTTFGIIGVKVWIYRGEILDPNASMARGTTTDPMNEVKVERGARRNDRGPRRDRGDR